MSNILYFYNPVSGKPTDRVTERTPLGKLGHVCSILEHLEKRGILNETGRIVAEEYIMNVFGNAVCWIKNEVRRKVEPGDIVILDGISYLVFKNNDGVWMKSCVGGTGIVDQVCCSIPRWEFKDGAKCIWY